MSRYQKKCEMVQDMLPAIRDLSASAASREFVSRHLVTCRNCRESTEAMIQETKAQGKVRETAALQSLLPTDRELRYGLSPRSPAMLLAAVSMAAALILASVLCFIVEYMLYGTFSWSVIVAAACAFAASFLVTPFAANRYRLAKTGALFILGLFVLLRAISWYTGGRWGIVAFCGAVVLLSAVFLPIILMTLPATEDRAALIGLITLTWESVWVVLLIAAIAFFLAPYGFRDVFLQRAIPYTAMGLLLAWAEYVLAAVLPGQGLPKVSACVALGGVFCLVVYRLLDPEDRALLGRPILVGAFGLLVVSAFLYLLSRWWKKRRGRAEA